MVGTINVLVFALEHKEYNTAAKMAISLYAQYVEGELESAKDAFNRLRSQFPLVMWELMLKQNQAIGFSGLDKVIHNNISLLV